MCPHAMDDKRTLRRLNIIIALLLIIIALLLLPMLPLIVVAVPLLLLLGAPILIWLLMNVADE